MSEQYPNYPPPQQPYYPQQPPPKEPGIGTGFKLMLGAILAIFVLIIGGCVACGILVGGMAGAGAALSNSNTAAPGIKTQEKPIDVSAQMLAQTYTDNEVKADSLYEHKTLAVTGKIKSIDSMFGSNYVILEGKDYVDITCTFDDDRKNEIIELKKNQPVVILGYCTGKSLNVSLDHCAVKK